MFQAARQDGVFGACGEEQYVTEHTDMLCDAILNAVLWDELEHDVTHPVVICHSPEDETVGIVNVPPMMPNPNVNFYEPNLSLLAPRGNHFIAEIICALDPVTVIAFGRETYPLVQMQTLEDFIDSDDPTRHVPEICTPKREEKSHGTHGVGGTSDTQFGNDTASDELDDDDYPFTRSGGNAVSTYPSHVLLAMLVASVLSALFL